MNETQWILDSRIGRLHLVATTRGLRGVFWTRQAAPLARSLGDAGSVLAQAARELEEYLAGERRAFTLALDVEAGTPFQRRVWSELARIPYGKTLSYTELADRAGNPRAVRAVGTANGRNPLSIIVPCHRVIAADGSLGGYAGGLSAKALLLELERVASREAGLSVPEKNPW